MTRDDDFIGQLESYLDEFEGITPLPAAVRNAVRAQLPTTKQVGPPGWLLGRFPIMNINVVRFGITAVAAALAVVLGINFLSQNVGGDPEPTATPTPSATTPPGDASREVSLAAGFPVRITYQVPEGWWDCSSSPVEQGTCEVAGGDVTGVSISFLIVDNVVADPCSVDGRLLDPPVGPSVDDLVTAISNLEGFEATEAVDVTVDGFDGKQFTLTAPGRLDCELKTWATSLRINGVGPGEVNDMRILDVDGVRVFISGGYQSDSVSRQLSALQQVIASIQIEP